MLSVAPAAAVSSSSGNTTHLPAATVTDSTSELGMDAWEALIAQRKNSVLQTAPPLFNPPDADILPSARPADSKSAGIIPRRANTSQSLSSLSSLAPYRPPCVTSNDEPIACRLSGLRIKDRRQAQSELERQLARCKIVKMAALSKWQHDMQAKGQDAQQTDWALFGVIAMKSDIRTSSRGEKYVIATLCDLSGHLVSCFLFGAAFREHYKEDVGSVIAVANAKFLSSDTPPSSASSHASTSSSSHTFLSLSLSVSQPTQLLVLGASVDFALCASYKREQAIAGGPSSSSLLHCKNIVDTRKGKYCDFHVREEYKRVAGSRPGINKAMAGELNGLVRFGDKRQVTVAKGGRLAGGTGARFGGGAGGGGLGSVGWGSSAASSNDAVFSVAPMKRSGKVAPTATAVATKPTAIFKPSTNSAHMLALIQAERIKTQQKAATAPITFTPSHSSTSAVSHPTKKQPALPASVNPPTPAAVTPTASAAGPRATRILAAVSTSVLNTKPPQPIKPTNPPITNPTPSTLPPPSDNPFASLTIAVQKPKPLSRDEATRELRRLHAMKALAKHGPVAAPDPNSTLVDNSHIARTTAAAVSTAVTSGNKRKLAPNATIQATLTTDGAMSVTALPSSASVESSAVGVQAPTSPASVAKRARLDALFGLQDMSTSRYQQLLSASSAHVELLADMKAEEREQYWQWLEAKEEMQLQMEAIREQQVEVWVCADCHGRRTLHYPTVCKERGHRLDKRPAVKRFFECGQCRSRVTTVDSALPLHCCHKCGAAQWKGTGMASERSTLAASVRSELQHKSEETWLKSSSGMEGSLRNDDPNNQQDRPLSDI